MNPMSVPINGQPRQIESPISSVNQPIREPSLDDIGWLRPVWEDGEMSPTVTRKTIMQNKFLEKRKRWMFLRRSLERMIHMMRMKEWIITKEEVGLGWYDEQGNLGRIKLGF
ncbi:hypothetical protein LINPERPRIM_LOCUS30381 [Linum perenne]